MNKKIIALIIAILVIVGIVVAIIAINGKSDNNGQNLNNNEKQAENNNGDKNTENGDDEHMNDSDKKILILYFSQSGNTETVAEYIENRVGGDIVKLETEETYPSDYDTLVDYAQEKKKEKRKTEVEN